MTAMASISLSGEVCGGILVWSAGLWARKLVLYLVMPASRRAWWITGRITSR